MGNAVSEHLTRADSYDYSSHYGRRRHQGNASRAGYSSSGYDTETNTHGNSAYTSTPNSEYPSSGESERKDRYHTYRENDDTDSATAMTDMGHHGTGHASRRRSRKKEYDDTSASEETESDETEDDEEGREEALNEGSYDEDTREDPESYDNDDDYKRTLRRVASEPVTPYASKRGSDQRQRKSSAQKHSPSRRRYSPRKEVRRHSPRGHRRTPSPTKRSESSPRRRDRRGQDDGTKETRKSTEQPSQKYKGLDTVELQQVEEEAFEMYADIRTQGTGSPRSLEVVTSPPMTPTSPKLSVETPKLSSTGPQSQVESEGYEVSKTYSDVTPIPVHIDATSGDQVQGELGEPRILQELVEVLVETAEENAIHYESYAHDVQNPKSGEAEDGDDVHEEVELADEEDDDKDSDEDASNGEESSIEENEAVEDVIIQPTESRHSLEVVPVERMDKNKSSSPIIPKLLPSAEIPSLEDNGHLLEAREESKQNTKQQKLIVEESRKAFRQRLQKHEFVAPTPELGPRVFQTGPLFQSQYLYVQQGISKDMSERHPRHSRSRSASPVRSVAKDDASSAHRRDEDNQTLASQLRERIASPRRENGADPELAKSETDCDQSVEASKCHLPEEKLVQSILNARIKQALAQGADSDWPEDLTQRSLSKTGSLLSLASHNAVPPTASPDDAADVLSEMDDVDLYFVQQYEMAFDVFMQQNIALMARNPELVYNLRVAKLQKMLQATTDVEASLRKLLETKMEEKQEMLSTYKKQLVEAARRKAALEIHLRHQLSIIHQATVAMQGKITWQTLVKNDQRAKRHYQLLQKLTNDKSDPIAMLLRLPESSSSPELRDAVTARASAQFTSKEEKEVRQLQVDTAFLKAEVKVLEKKLAAEQAVAKKFAWVDSLLIRMDANHMKKLKSRYQQKLGATF